MNSSFAVVSPLANEADTFHLFTSKLQDVLRSIDAPKYKVFFVVDNASKDNTLDLCKEMSARDEHFVTV